MTAWTHRCLSAGKAAQKIVPLRPRTPCWKGLGADSEEKREPVSDINTAIVDGLKVLDPRPPIREAVIQQREEVHEKAMPGLPLTADQREAWMTADMSEALALRRPAPDAMLKLVARGEKRDDAQLRMALNRLPLAMKP